MGTIYRKVMCSDRLPKVGEGVYLTFDFLKPNCCYWIEEIELPSEGDKQVIVKDWYNKQQFQSNYPAEPSSFMAGFNKAIELIKGGVK